MNCNPSGCGLFLRSFPALKFFDPVGALVPQFLAFGMLLIKIIILAVLCFPVLLGS